MPDSTWLAAAGPLPTYALLLAEGFTPVSGSLTISALSVQYYGYAAIQTANGDEMKYVLPLAAGVYDVRVLTRTGASHGIADLYLDGVEFHSLDLYSASTVNNVFLTKSSLVVTSSGLHTLSLKTDGKNASSSSYDRHVTSVRITPH
ncbi:MAG: hypothetical protein R3C10_03665 [Pirellulales bacterium]|nr:hypothetical protein [Planctomycetales bacterium]